MPTQTEIEAVAKAIYDAEPYFECGEYADGFIPPGAPLTWEQAKARDAEFADDDEMMPITSFPYRAAKDALDALEKVRNINSLTPESGGAPTIVMTVSGV